jgi:hypothetical protein
VLCLVECVGILGYERTETSQRRAIGSRLKLQTVPQQFVDQKDQVLPSFVALWTVRAECPHDTAGRIAQNQFKHVSIV